MEKLLDSFISSIKEENLTVLYAQIRQHGEVTDSWSRFEAKESRLTGFRGVSRFESYSTAKSFSAVGAGIALDEGLIRMDEKVADSFPDCVYDVTNPYALDITVRDMLLMSAGVEKPMFFRDSPERATVRNWPRYFYEQSVFLRPPGEKFLYNNADTYMLGCLVERKAGVNLLEYMRYRLFEPLGIGNPDMTSCPLGHTVAANGMAINIDEMGRFCEMMLRGGVYNGKRIVSEEFCKAALAPQIKTDVPLFVTKGGGSFDYGYHFWVDTENNVSFLNGILGQRCVIIPEKDAAAMVLSLEQNEQRLSELFWDQVVLAI
ncbi:MAG: beta-lactamase family protein [Defluviitaleaceae bacterium]|nr:beta-lactamase family protein [Defluviitaleaceae bacterium]